MSISASIKIYHIVHIDNLTSIIKSDGLLSDAKMQARGGAGTIIGMDRIKKRRLTKLTLTCHPNLYVGQCVPFYFCPRSVMLYVIHRRNHPNISYRSGQQKIVHLEADLYKTVAWAKENNKRWAFTLSNAGSDYFEDRSDLKYLHEIDWNAVNAEFWQECGDKKQAEFLIEDSFSWKLIERIGTYSNEITAQVMNIQQGITHKPSVETIKAWYY